MRRKAAPVRHVVGGMRDRNPKSRTASTGFPARVRNASTMGNQVTPLLSASTAGVVGIQALGRKRYHALLAGVPVPEPHAPEAGRVALVLLHESQLLHVAQDHVEDLPGPPCGAVSWSRGVVHGTMATLATPALTAAVGQNASRDTCAPRSPRRANGARSGQC
jgi:hypothetical protein